MSELALYRKYRPSKFADGEKRAKIKEAEGYKQAKILHAEGEAEAIKLVNEAADKFFTGNAQLLKKLETLEISLKDNAKIVIPEGSELVNIIGDLAGVMPLRKKDGHKEAAKE
jgi:regulator of protease activity HflC (stomatin/prohibitin superfamily)